MMRPRQSADSRVPIVGVVEPAVAPSAAMSEVTGVTAAPTIVATVDGKSANSAIGVDAPPPAPLPR